MTTAFVILGILVCLFLSAFCSSAEMSYSYF
jgi:CBS domain containing-hemolysin-like protein